MPQVVVERLGAGEGPAASALLAAARRAGEHRFLGDDPAFTLLASEAGRPGPVGLARIDRDHNGWSVELVLGPASSPGGSRRQRLLAAAVDLVGREGGGALRLWAHDATSEDDELAAAAGLAAERDLYQMRRSLPPRGRSPLATRPFVVGEDEAAWLAVNNRSFAGHPEQGGWTSERLRHSLVQPWFDPGGLLLHERDGRLAGFCWAKVHSDVEPAVGELHVIAVDPDFQGLGLGRQLSAAGLDWLSDRGLESAILYVDASNQAAVGLYESLGFHVHHVDRAYAGVVPPISEPSA